MKNQFVLTPYFIDEYWPELEDLAQDDWVLNKVDLPSGEQQSRLSLLHEPLAAFAHEAVIRGDRPVSIAGDCCTTIGILAGLQRANIDPILIWFDAHGDFNTWETTPSGFLGGMPLAMLVGHNFPIHVCHIQLQKLRTRVSQALTGTLVNISKTPVLTNHKEGVGSLFDQLVKSLLASP